MIKVHIQYFNQFKRWQHYQTKHHEADAYRTAKNRATRKFPRNKSEKTGIKDLVPHSSLIAHVT